MSKEKEQEKVLTLKDRYDAIMKHWDSMEQAILGKNGYANALFFWDDMHQLNDMIKEFMNMYFSGQNHLDRFNNLNMFSKVNAIHIKIKLP